MKYKTIQNACKKAQFNQITLSNLISGRFYHVSKGWTKLSIDEKELNMLRDELGGKYDLLRPLMDIINYNGSNYGIFERVVFNGKRWGYIAGQDYPSELRTVRKLIREG
jgi:hypothetical protein